MMWTLKIISNRMKAMKNIFRILAGTGFVLSLLSCSGEYNPLPPKTDSSVQYALPYPEKPSQEELDRLQEIRIEHENATK